MSSSHMENYRKIDVVGKGSFGCAVLVQSVIDRKYYIMKIIDVSKMDRKQKEEALNEVTLLKNMRHPFIITYRESFMDKNRYLCIVMDYAEGGDMYTKIGKQRKIGKGFPESQILDWFVQICLALKYVHDRKILHRDLKTQNIFLTAKGDIKIGDFGIARVLQDTYDCAQTAIGTPYYLSPEICQEKPYNQKSDIWSLGCILYELVTLRHAFDANSMKGLVLKILRGTYPSIPTNYSPELRDLIAEMLTKEPSKRPSIKKILEKDFLSSRIASLVTNAIVKNELGSTLLNKIEPALKNNDPTPEKVLSSQHSSASREYLADKSNMVINQSDQARRSYREKDSSILKGLDDDKKTPSNNASVIASNVNVNMSVNNSFSRKSSAYISNNDVVQKQDESIEKRRSSSVTRSYDSRPDISKKVEEEQKQYVSKPGLSNYLKENKPNLPQPVVNQGPTKEEEEQYKNLLQEVKELEQRKNNKGKKDDSDDENFEEEEDKRVYAKFLTLDGKEIPGCGDMDPISYRIEALRVYLEKQLGEKPFYDAYKFLQDPPNEGEHNSVLMKILGKQNLKYVSLIYQMIVCEDAYYGSN